jgi:hypothetical protein
MRTTYPVSLLVVFAWSLSLWSPGAPALASAHHAHGDIGASVSAMTLDEKISLLIGNPIAGRPDSQGLAGARYAQGVPHLGIPLLRFCDRPAGARTVLPTTAPPAPAGLAATFSTDLAGSYGRVLTRAGVAQLILAGPGLILSGIAITLAVTR